jgi:hypothetical protein
MVTRETWAVAAEPADDPFASIADWDDAAPDTREWGWVPRPIRPRPELTATRWGRGGVKSELYRDDPPA